MDSDDTPSRLCAAPMTMTSEIQICLLSSTRSMAQHIGICGMNDTIPGRSVQRRRGRPHIVERLRWISDIPEPTLTASGALWLARREHLCVGQHPRHGGEYRPGAAHAGDAREAGTKVAQDFAAWQQFDPRHHRTAEQLGARGRQQQ